MSPELTAQLLALPALRKQAEEDARELSGFDLIDWQEFDPDVKGDDTDRHGRLLADFTRWQSQAWALREIGRLIGWNCGDDVPQISKVEYRSGYAFWSLKLGISGWVWGDNDIPGIAAMDRPSAIAAILLHLSGDKS